ncbi:MAG: TIR domain-containing protein [Bacteroidia bacterium]
MAQKIFINYSQDPDDIKLFQNLYLHLGIIRDFEIWHVGKILAGTDRQVELDKRFAESEIVLPILTVNYLNDETCMQQFANARLQQKKLFPLLASSFDIDSFDDLKDYDQNIVPNDKSFLETANNLDVACTQIIRELRGKILGKKAAKIGGLADSRKFLYILTIIPIVLGIATGIYFYSQEQLSSIALIGSFLIGSISLFPLAKLIWPTNVSTQKVK